MTSDDRVELLRRVPLFADLDPDDQAEIAGSLRERTFAAGETVVTEGHTGIGFFVIADGEARVSVLGEERGRLGPGDYFGEIAFVLEGGRTATVTAQSDLRCLSLSAWEFRPLVERNGALAWKLLQALAKKLPAREHAQG